MSCGPQEEKEVRSWLVVDGPIDDAGGARLLSWAAWGDGQGALSESFPCFDIATLDRE